MQLKMSTGGLAGALFPHLCSFIHIFRIVFVDITGIFCGPFLLVICIHSKQVVAIYP